MTTTAWTLKALKDSIEVGTRLRVLDHAQEKYRGTVRTVTKVQGNGFFFTMPETGDQRLWSPFPLRSQLTFLGESSFRVEIDGEHYWTLQLERTP